MAVRLLVGATAVASALRIPPAGQQRVTPALASRRALVGGAAALSAALGVYTPAALAEEAPGAWAKHSGAFTDTELGSLKETASGLRYSVLQEGFGVKPTAGQAIKCHYSGYLLSGKKFDSSYDRKAPLRFAVGVSQVIKGWDEALLDMKVGERRLLVIPPSLAYGSKGAGGVIPPDATLVFYVELTTLAA